MVAKNTRNKATNHEGQPIQPGEQLGWGVGLSLVVHLFLVAVIVFWPGLTSSSRKDFVPTYNVNLVAAPRLEPPAPPAPPALPKKVSVPKPQPKAKPKVKSKPRPKPKPKPKAVVKRKPKPKPKPKPKVVKRKPPRPKPKPKVAIGTQKTAKRKPKPVKRKPVDQTKKYEEALERRMRSMKAKVEKKKVQEKVREKEKERLDDVLDSLQSKVAKREVDDVLSSIKNRVAKREPDPVQRPNFRTQPSAVAASGPSVPLATGTGPGSGTDHKTMRQQIYIAEVRAKVMRHWVLAKAFVEDTSGLMAMIFFVIKPDGKVSGVRVEKSSGNSRYDESCERAVTKASPFPKLPPEEKGKPLEVVVRFRPVDKG